MEESRLDEFCNRVVGFLEGLNIPYLVIGGVAASVIGEPRMTQDIDLILFIKKNSAKQVLESAIVQGFEVKIEIELERIRQTGTFRLNQGLFHADIIIASTQLEESAFARAQKIKFIDRMAYFPSPKGFDSL
jgi:hypothetical protein